MKRHFFRPLLLSLIATVGLGAAGFGQAVNNPRLALQYWQAGDYPDYPNWEEEQEWVDGHMENEGQGHWTDSDGDGEDDTWVSEAYWVNAGYQSNWVLGNDLVDGLMGSSWATNAGTFNINSELSGGLGSRGYLLFHYEVYDLVTFRAWGLAPSNNCNHYSYAVYRPDGSRAAGYDYNIGLFFPGGSAMMQDTVYTDQSGQWRIDVRYHEPTAGLAYYTTEPAAGTVSYFFLGGIAAADDHL